MLVLQRSITFLLVAAAVAEAANLRQEHRTLQTYTPSDNYFSVMLDRVNHERAAQGLPALCTNKKLQEAAQRHSDDQAANNYMAHEGTDGTNIDDRITQAGFDWSAVAENVAAGQLDVDSVMESWMNSPGHRANILGDYTMFGTAYAYNAAGTYQHYWTQDFGTGDAEECDGGSIASEAESTIAALVKSSEAEDTSNATDAPVVIDPPEIGITTETLATSSKTEDSCSGSQDTEAPYTDAPVVVVDPPFTQGSEAEDSCSGSQETEAPYTDAPVVVVDPPFTQGSDAEDSCSGSQETEAPYTDAPVVVVDPPFTQGSDAEDSCSGSQETYAPTIDQPEETPVVVVDPPEIGTPTPEVVYNTYDTPSVQLPATDKPHHEKDCDPGF